MRIAVKYDAASVDADGHVAGHAAGDTLVRRILRIFPGSILIGAPARRCQGFDVEPLEFIDPADTVVINMDVIDSPRIWQKLQRPGEDEPRIMNFLWWTPRTVTSDVGIALLALSCAVFPTFANSERTANEIREVVNKWSVPQLSNRAKLGWVNLGFRLAHVRPRVQTDVPVVLYPAIYLSAAKRPDDFSEVVEWVRKQTPIKVEMRLHESHLVSERAMRFSRRDWIWVGPLTASRSSYWEALAHTTAFLATASDESYGLSYVEALGAGVIGIFPDRPWARALVPEGYPFFYRDLDEAKEMLLRAVTEPDECRAEMERCVDGTLSDWIAKHHSDDAFDVSLVAHVKQWFG
ncbi:MAG: glycosyltransferase family 1 protein [Actinomycetaceae bacterium]|nr:glycosyltransferase family 1 protein [Actinomycetaceae bacterium]MDU0970426.1 glycosyltransferase family 1 protein [Actinomycetaceae bacterium]